MVGWHRLLSGHEFEQTPGDSEGQGSLECCIQFMELQRAGHDLVTEQKQHYLLRVKPVLEIFQK